MNVILVILDSLRKDHVGCYGNPWIRTPTMDALSEESVVFTRAFPESLPTIPVRRAVHTGNRTFPFRDYEPRKGDTVRTYGWQPIPEEQVTLAEVLSNAGYRTAFITDTYHQFKPSMNFHRGFSEWRWIRGQEVDPFRSAPPPEGVDVEHYIASSGKGPRGLIAQYLSNMSYRKGEEDWLSPRVFREAMRWLEENRDAEKFFLCVDSFDPHEPWDPPYEYRELYYPGYTGREVISPSYGPSDYLTEEELRYMRACYAGEVTLVDRWLGFFIERARELGMLDDTLLVLVSDHGHQLGEHGLVGKVPRGLYPELMDIPLFIRHPHGIGAGRRVDEFVYNCDIFPTILDFLGIEPPMEVDGRSLRPLVTGEGEFKSREYVTSAFNRYVWVRDEDYAYIARGDGEEAELFDLRKDPEQRVNIAGERPDVAEGMFERMLRDAGGEFPDHSHKMRRPPEEWYKLY